MSAAKKNYLTKYECARIIGLRAAQLSSSAPVLVDLVDIPSKFQNNLFYIAAKELQLGKVDIKIQRPLPNNEYYEVLASDSILPDDLQSFIDMCEDPA